jgi:hypothetical protein
MNMEINELSAEELDCVSGGGIVSDASAAIAAAARAIVDGINGALSGALPGGGLFHQGPSGVAPKSTWL